LPHKAQDIKAALLKKGFQPPPKAKKRDHDYFFFYYNGKKTNIFTKVSRGERDIHDQNCSNMAKQMRLTNPQFKEFVQCPLELKDYLQLLIKQNYLR
jgi:hypothetical protein